MTQDSNISPCHPQSLRAVICLLDGRRSIERCPYVYGLNGEHILVSRYSSVTKDQHNRSRQYLLRVTLGRQRAGSSVAASPSFGPPLLSTISVSDTFKLASSSSMPKTWINTDTLASILTPPPIAVGSPVLPSSLLFFFRIEFLPGLVSCLDLSHSLTILFRRSGEILNLS